MGGLATSLTIVLQGLGLFLLIWLVLPDLLAWSGLVRVRGWIAGTPEGVSLPRADGVPADIRAELQRLGFEPLGLYFEKCGASRTFREHVFASRQDRAFATAYALFVGERARVSFLTQFQTGGFVLTQDYQGGTEADEESFRAGGVEGTPLEEVLEEHRRRVRRFIIAGQTPTERYDLEDFGELQIAFYHHPRVAKPFRFISLCNGLTTLTITALAPVILMTRMGFNHLLPWALLVALCGVWAYVLRYGIPCLTMPSRPNGEPGDSATTADTDDARYPDR